MFKKVILFVLLIPSMVSGQSYIATNVTEIKMVHSYNQFGGGDVFFQVETPISECSSGYWLTKNDLGFNANLSMIISAYHAKSPVRVFGLPDQLWVGTGGNACKLYSIEFR